MSAAPTSDSPPLDAPRSELIEAALRQASQFDANCPSQLGEAIRYSLLAPGKRLRPHLVLYAAEACGGAEAVEQALPAAVAVEMIHAYSLVHDDLPAMDDDDLRRGRPTCHKQFNEAVAILVGDALQARAFEVLATDVQPPAVAAKCCAVLARAAGATALVGGQADDLAMAAMSGSEPSGDLAELEAIHSRKTGALIMAALELGGLVAEATPAQLAALKAFGRNIGLAFQITDDLLDVSGDENAVGKRLAKDADHGKLTFPRLLGVEASRRNAEKLVEEACVMIEVFGEQGLKLRELAQAVLTRTK